ncbi:MAG TPA: hypothetical protein PLR99_25255, partial [Polyangiaceae bacterium]|nr:hypothetical protein [Polyangiaceae bacterium]
KGLLSLKAAALGLASLALVGGAAIAVTRPPSAPPTAETRPVATVVAETARPEAPPAPSALAPLDVIEATTAPSAPAPVLSAPRAPAPSALLAPRASADVDDLAAEAALLRAAQDGLRGDPTVALARASEHARRFPRGALTQEREAIAIEALVKLGRGAEARARADRFAKSFPGSTHQRRLDALVGNER